MHLVAKLCGLSALLCVLLDSCMGGPACPCQSQSPTSPDNSPCDNCYDSCKDVPTLNNTSIAALAVASPVYQVLITAAPGFKQIDNVCITFFPVDGSKMYLEIINYVFTDGTYFVSVYLLSDTDEPGVTRVTGFESDSGESTAVTNAYAFGSVSCPNCTNQPLIAVYSCVQFSDCSLISEQNYDDLFVLADTPDISDDCLEQVKAALDQGCFQQGDIQFPPHNQHRKCVTRFNGAPCYGEEKVPVGDRIAYPPAQSNCTS